MELTFCKCAVTETELVECFDAELKFVADN